MLVLFLTCTHTHTHTHTNYMYILTYTHKPHTHARTHAHTRVHYTHHHTINTRKFSTFTTQKAKFKKQSVTWLLYLTKEYFSIVTYTCLWLLKKPYHALHFLLSNVARSNKSPAHRVLETL